MSYAYSQYNERFRESANTIGFRYSFRHTLSMIPAAFLHLGDSLLGLDGTLGKDRDNYLHGPLGAIVGYPLMWLGSLIGTVLQTIFNIPSFLGHYLFDRPMDYFFPGARTAMIDSGSFLEDLGALLYTAITSLPLPKEMRGFFGFIFGIVPELLRYGVNRLLATVTSVLKFCIDNVCDGIRSVYSFVDSLIFSPQQVPDPNPNKDASNNSEADNNNQADPDKKKKRRIVRPADLGAAQGVDLFACLGITKEAYEKDSSVANKAFKKAALYAHPDKAKQLDLENKRPHDADAARDKWEALKLAKETLTDPLKAQKYLTAYKNSSAFFNQQKPASASNEAAPTSKENASARVNEAPKGKAPEDKPATRRKIIRT